jgi:hypothetical protein
MLSRLETARADHRIQRRRYCQKAVFFEQRYKAQAVVASESLTTTTVSPAARVRIGATLKQPPIAHPEG